jgi:DNA-nicking Smr family endonuclease
MARRKRRKPLSPQPQASGNDRFHTPFGELKALLREVGSPPPAAALQPSAGREAKPQAPPGSPVNKPKSQPSSETSGSQEQALFLAEMAGVKRLSVDRRGRVEKRRQGRRRDREPAYEVEALADLLDLVEGRGTFSIQYTDEYMEGVAPGIDRRLAQRLHRGDFAVQAHLDLHGYTVDEAKDAVDRFLTAVYASGRRCVRLVHGRGHNSIDNRPVLKEQVRLWLSHGRLSRLVLAFATAPATDGGAGAVYVLLRRGPHTSRRTE